MERFYCTYFDREYLSRGLALHASLLAHARPFRLFILCLDDATYEAVRGLPATERLRMGEFEDAFPALAATRKQRTPREYYCSCTPALVEHVFARSPEAEELTYLDADLLFFSSPEDLHRERGGGSIAVIEHRFPEGLRHLEVYGRFNVGWVTFTRQPEARRCLARWRDQCVEWCHDRPEPGRFGDQGYLDEWPALYPRLVILQHKGADLAPWNVARYEIRQEGGRVLVDGQPLVFYHFHGLRPRPRPYTSGLAPFGAEMTAALRRGVYWPYLRALTAHGRRREQPC